MYHLLPKSRTISLVLFISLHITWVTVGLFVADRELARFVAGAALTLEFLLAFFVVLVTETMRQNGMRDTWWHEEYKSLK